MPYFGKNLLYGENRVYFGVKYGFIIGITQTSLMLMKKSSEIGRTRNMEQFHKPYANHGKNLAFNLANFSKFPVINPIIMSTQAGGDNGIYWAYILK